MARNISDLLPITGGFSLELLKPDHKKFGFKTEDAFLDGFIREMADRNDLTEIRKLDKEKLEIVYVEVKDFPKGRSAFMLFRGGKTGCITSSEVLCDELIQILVMDHEIDYDDKIKFPDGIAGYYSDDEMIVGTVMMKQSQRNKDQFYPTFREPKEV